jgi:hypothetical protein
MSFNYARSQQTAERLIKRFGQTGAIRKTTAGSGDPWNPGAGTAADTPCTLAITNYSERDRDGTLIQQGDRKAIVAPKHNGALLSVVPENGDQLVVDGVPYQIVNIDRIAPAGTVVLYEIQIR